MRILRDYFITIITFLILAGCGESNTTQPHSTTQPTTISAAASAPSTLQQVADNAVENNDVSGIILLSQKGEEEAHIVASGIDIQNQPLFKIASISKLFMAVAATKLANENTLNLQDTVAIWLPELASNIANLETATLKQVIEHRSGIPDFDSQPGFSWDHPHTDTSAMLKFIQDKPADFSPNAHYEYSNSNYLLLGMVMDVALGFNHEKYIQHEILNSFALQNTFLQQADAPQEALVTGFWDGRDMKAQEYTIPGGSMVASADDIGVFIGALNRGTLLSEDEASIYPYFYEHTGWLPGYQSVARYDAASDTVIVVFTASTGGNSSTVTEKAFNQIRNIARQ
ncbi:serine hydrolase domain-containing protein [Alteromonas sp. ASW11-130]|uniref:serine hydrolase domain-containing protein n=1 Tax=Alteromonas sp. ASW11-130 TaxID=3015775 RepID=UPI00224191DC|nr:serine hydrolase domain-containing protein [Alteromonas sp. ASW11-130]MCW8091756.1 beta-lactamase family protein [Alteromonas sp. ASW11-130]